MEIKKKKYFDKNNKDLNRNSTTKEINKINTCISIDDLKESSKFYFF